MKAAIWSAVSTAEQAKKISIDVQIKKARAAIAENGWTETATYIIPGESRTKYISLYHAERSIPQLNKMLEDAAAAKFEVLILYDLNRFRSLMLQIFDALADYNIQLYNLSDPHQPVPPHLYTPERKRAARINVGLHDIISNTEINNLQTHYREKLPAKVKSGLHPGLGSTPYGYTRSPNSKEKVFIQNPEQIATINIIKELYLNGHSFREIAAYLNAKNIPSPRGGTWRGPQLRYILQNPYYAGTVRFGATTTIRDKRTVKTTVVKNQQPSTQAKGLHTPVWDENTRLTLLERITQRGNSYTGTRTRRWTSLIKCHCGRTAYASQQHGRLNWRCSTHKAKHLDIPDATLTQLIIQQLTTDIKTLQTIPAPKKSETIETALAEIKEIKTRQARLLELYETESLDIDTYKRRIAALNARLETTSKRLARLQQNLAETATAHTTITELKKNIENIPAYIQNAPQQQVNTQLRQILNTITITPTRQIKIHWK